MIYTYEAINKLDDEELSFLLFLVLRANPNLEALDINKNILKTFKLEKLKERLFNARNDLNTENQEGVKIYNSLCEKFGVQGL